MQLRLTHLIIAVLLVSTNLFSNSPVLQLKKEVLKTTGIQEISIESKILPKSKKDQETAIVKITNAFKENKSEWKDVKKAIKKSKINVTKMLFSDEDGITVDFSYSATLPNFSAEIFVDVKDGKVVLPQGVSEIVSYITQIKDVLSKTDLSSLNSLLSYRAQGEKICFETSPLTGQLAEFVGMIHLGKMDLEKLKISNQIKEDGKMVYNIKNYLMSKQLKSKPEASAEIKKIFSDDPGLSDESISSNILEVINKNDLNHAQLRTLFSEPVEYNTVVNRIKEIMAINLDAFSEVERSDKELTEILGYYDFPIGLTCLVSKLNKDHQSTVNISMDNSYSPPVYEKIGVALYLNMEDFFYK